MLERNASVGDNWALRYDCLQFHVPTSFCEMPFMSMLVLQISPGFSFSC